MNPARFAVACALALTGGHALACFTVYAPDNRVVYNAQEPPVDMRYPIHETLPRVFPGGHMVFGTGQDCPRTDARWQGRPDVVARLMRSSRIDLMPGIANDGDVVITELHDPPLTVYSRVDGAAR
ncbi:MAG: hypothetical protein KF686_14425 [Ramlibacter sp.]|nr:hypothetical protein [Ramlibacter sp.]